MDIGKKAVIAIGMVCAIGATSAPATAQLTCGWCFGPAYGSGSDAGHGFPYAGGECGWRGSQFGMNCARCGGDGSSCHVPIQTGSCHIPCGPAGDEATAALTGHSRGVGKRRCDCGGRRFTAATTRRFCGVHPGGRAN